MSIASDAKPNINVTPLIDVLLVLLIIFMVISPSKPSTFKAKVPAEQPPIQEPLKSHPDTLIVKINLDSTLSLNLENNVATVAEPQKLIENLADVFQTRLQNGVYDENLAGRNDLSEMDKVQRTVFIKAPKNFNYGDVAKVVDAVKQAGANPVGLQIDELE